MALTFFWRCEGTTLDWNGTSGNDYSAGDTSAEASDPAPAINATAALVGSNGIQITAAGQNYSFDTASIITPAEGAVGFKVRIQTWEDAASFFYARGDTYQDAFVIGMDAGDELYFRINEDVDPIQIATDSASLTTGTTYFVTAAWQDGTGFRLRVYNDSTAALIDEATGGDFVVGDDLNVAFRWGDSSGVGTPAYYLDNIFMGSAWGDDETFVTNRNITSRTSYSAGGSSPSITPTVIAAALTGIAPRMDLGIRPLTTVRI